MNKIFIKLNLNSFVFIDTSASTMNQNVISIEYNNQQIDMPILSNTETIGSLRERLSVCRFLEQGFAMCLIFFACLQKTINYPPNNLLIREKSAPLADNILLVSLSRSKLKVSVIANATNIFKGHKKQAMIILGLSPSQIYSNIINVCIDIQGSE